MLLCSCTGGGGGNLHCYTGTPSLAFRARSTCARACSRSSALSTTCSSARTTEPLACVILVRTCNTHLNGVSTCRMLSTRAVRGAVGQCAMQAVITAAAADEMLKLRRTQAQPSAPARRIVVLLASELRCRLHYSTAARLVTAYCRFWFGASQVESSRVERSSNSDARSSRECCSM